MAAVRMPIVTEHHQELASLFDAHHARVYRAAYRITGNAADAEDVLQTVFLRLLRRESGTVVADSAESYLYRAAVNAGLDVVRSRRGGAQVPLEAVEAVLPSDRLLSPDGQHDNAELRRWLRSAIAGLHATAAEMFVLRYFEGLDNPEIARLMGTSQGVVAVTLHRTRTRLQNEYRSHRGGRS